MKTLKTNNSNNKRRAFIVGAASQVMLVKFGKYKFQSLKVSVPSKMNNSIHYRSIYLFFRNFSIQFKCSYHIEVTQITLNENQKADFHMIGLATSPFLLTNKKYAFS